MAIRQAYGFHGQRRAADAECAERERDGLDFARGVLLAVLFSVPLWAVAIAALLLALSAR